MMHSTYSFVSIYVRAESNIVKTQLVIILQKKKNRIVNNMCVHIRKNVFSYFLPVKLYQVIVLFKKGILAYT